ncbi:hypothetical protein Trydic_g23153, partial [Trypoxylus dichotomus]
MSSSNSLCQPLTKFLLSVIAGLSGNPQSANTNTKYFINKIEDVELNEEDKLESFDVTSLLTYVPIEASS